ncbi:MAG: stage III sporulation protein AA [Defluviitaleaceae bacterium]|nr:stage III sporulation protein AA [Defluviitaleaceae bacterium]
MTTDFVAQYLAAKVVQRLRDLPVEQITEIRLRVGRPLRVCWRDADGAQADNLPLVITAEMLAETMERISRYSYYAFEAELAAGYITLPGGHRVGVAGQAVVEGGAVRAWRHMGSLSVRVAHGILGCADGVLPIIWRSAARHSIYHTMIISPPGFGKTTLLRDMVRQISDSGVTVGLVDERSEIAGCFQGVPQNDVGACTDVLDGVPKHDGMVMLLRAMAPQVIAVDELGGALDAAAVEQILNAGVKLLCTAHGYGVDDIRGNPVLAGLMARGVFERFVVLDAPGRVAGVYDGGGAVCTYNS